MTEQLTSLGKPSLSAARSSAPRAALSPRRVLLLCPPFQYLHIASLSTARLATYLRREGIDCAEGYLHFEFARLLGEKNYLEVTQAELSAELLFAEGLHGKLDAAADDQLNKLFGDGSARLALLSRFEAACLGRVRASEAGLVGITTSNNQLLAALWMSKRIKEAMPEVRLVLGGSGCGEPMGQTLVDAYPHIDWVVSGYGEAPLLALAKGHSPESRLLLANERTPIASLPVAEFDRFLREANEFDNPKQLWLTYEGSRGCWWGMKHHCTFCGLNGEQMQYDEKPSAQVLDELRGLWSTYQRSVFATDLILSLRHLREVMPALAESKDGPPLFFEIKANLTQAQVISLARAKVSGFQPGIESLSSRHLKLIKKGTTQIQNIAVLKWSREQRVTLLWNLLCGIPGEEARDYDEQIALIEKISSLQPPGKVNPIRIDRYSPYFDDYKGHGWSAIKPCSEYRLLHPQLNDDQLKDIAYHFEGVGGVTTEPYLKRLELAVGDWHQRSVRGDGLFMESAQQLLRRKDGQVERLALSETTVRVMEKTHEIVGMQRLLEETGAGEAQVRELAARGILLIEDERVINLAVRKERPKA